MNRWRSVFLSYSRGRLMHRGLNVLADRRGLAYRGLSLPTSRRNILRPVVPDRLGRWVLVRRGCSAPRLGFEPGAGQRSARNRGARSG